MRARLVPLVVGLAISLSDAASAQWLNYPTPGIPRTADGRPNLTAAAPRMPDGKPDFTGMWRVETLLPCDDVRRMCTDLPISTQFGNLGAGLNGGAPYQPSVQERMKQRGPADDPYTRCLTPGGPRMHLLPTMKKFVQTPGLLILLNEFNISFRQVFLDGRPLPVDPNPTWNGYSVGRWDGDALVIESIGFRDDQWLDLTIDITIDDAKAYTRPWSTAIRLIAVPDTEMLDAQCLENEKDVPHLLNAK